MTRTRHTQRVRATRPAMASEAARRSVEAADLRALLMMVFHYSGDHYWLTDRFKPTRDTRLIAPEDAGLPEDVQHELREAAHAILCRETAPAVDVPEDELFLRMMSMSLGGQRVPADYVPMMREQMGLTSPLDGIKARGDTRDDDVLPVLVVGAGESGIALGAMLDDLGVDYRIVERGPTVGGTWRDNIYPGCAVDTPNHSYSYSFGRRHPWPRFFSSRPEIQEYLEKCADQFDVRRRIRFDTYCRGAVWDAKAARWRVTVEHQGMSEVIEARFFVAAIGPFGEPTLPDIAGLDTFRGPAVHSAKWTEDLDVAGKRVAVIGTGASCMQIAPTIAPDVAQLSIFQRTPQWIRPIERFHDLIDDDAQTLLSDEPYYAAWYRFIMMWRYGDGLLATLRKDPEWSHPERSLNAANDRHRMEMTRYIEGALASRPDLIERCVPDYPPYGKRILLDNGWYEMLTKPHVDLVTARIRAVEPDGVRLDTGELVAADFLVLATGFDVSRGASRLDIRGLEGVTLASRWEQGAGAYLGITVPGFPNMFLLQGPTTGLGHGGSAIFTSEIQARYTATMITKVLDSDLASVDVKADVHDEYLERVDDLHSRLVWTHPGMVPYYRNAFGKIRTVMPWRLVDYYEMTRRPELDDYHVTTAAAAAR
ncbi:NAD(P)/FAD-dependent oxidoreductase [Rhodococcus sp. CSLK01-03]|uniref:NAD(P)/FAD-dependent oxidoreductase n=1 Tax=Rhodococcus indonesiensis TaxID=3055869 RepID=A0ABT7RTB0_9NOCA|nr:NAD(P)/FAD-dependent oxidoreductase [Rhodococcus indonesiensis]MDM7490888.1 NAD(P)/FAD-dependent oxidoreductase [Rhodococcus indonesiensis]